ncbi:hypothetical protein EG849_11975 [Flavobacterium macacae]|uniref:Uncharacterized protein n=2 Tax=Flavobacterium macacae TaxID=2488993 RepID=A0A3P3W4Q8_9FLAO|nr:hypothetical protein EG849_11975 [Flavobacterium macacae]
MENLSKWRSRYSKTEYPEKVALNIFYRKYTMEFLFPEILDSFEDVKYADFNDGLEKLKTLYGSIAISKTQPILMELLEDVHRKVGTTNFHVFKSLISEVQNGSIEKLEELEYSYLYYLLTDECILLWAAFGGTGLKKLDVVSKLSGVIIKTDEINSYSLIEQIMGQLCASPYLNENYKPLPPNV